MTDPASVWASISVVVSSLRTAALYALNRLERTSAPHSGLPSPIGHHPNGTAWREYLGSVGDEFLALVGPHDAIGHGPFVVGDERPRPGHQLLERAPMEQFPVEE